MTLAYRGTHYKGWQRQPSDPSVQETLETALSTLLRQEIAVTGCGRTDTGVHARYYVAHFDAETPLPERALIGLNSLLPADIAVYQIANVPAEAHARFDAFERSYAYHIALRKDPFGAETSWLFPQAARLAIADLQSVAELLLKYEAFYPFCKTHSGVDTYFCALKKAYWEKTADGNGLVFHISANRFLRGMVRLIVGACINVASGKISLDQVKKSLDEQTTLPKSLSVPPQGLFLTDVRYPYEQPPPTPPEGEEFVFQALPEKA